MNISNKRLLARASDMIKRYHGVKMKKVVTLDPDVEERIDNHNLKPKKHCGIVPLRAVPFPDNIYAAIKSVSIDIPMKALYNESEVFVRYLKCRHPPDEEWEVIEKTKDAIKRVFKMKAIDVENKTREELEQIEKKYENNIKSMLKRHVYRWKSIDYDRYTSFKYLIGRGPAEYAVLRRIFEEIKVKNDDFKPKTFFDFGSGVGTGLWAVNDCWDTILNEYVTIDISNDMNDIAREIVKKAFIKRPIPMERIFQQRFLSAYSKTFDIVLSAYSLFELPSAVDRLKVITNLWRKTNRYLIIVENATLAGFKLITEARDFLLEINKESNEGFIFSPCSHHEICPRTLEYQNPCIFTVGYSGKELPKTATSYKDTYSYIVFAKGERTVESTWPRIIEPVLIRHKHVICRMCCNNGKRQEVIFTKAKHGKSAYMCAKRSNWGDSLPMEIAEVPKEVKDKPITDVQDEPKSELT